jgi:hypothetical protein
VLFCSKTETHSTLCTGEPSLGAKSGLPDEFSQKMFPITPPGNGNVGLGPRELTEFGFKVGENSPPPKKSPAKFRQKIKTTFLGHEFFQLFKLKLQYFFKNLLLNLPFFIFCKKKFFENLVFLTDTVADLAVRYTLCGRYTLCAHCMYRYRRVFTLTVYIL